jgi:hypothetical protein
MEDLQNLIDTTDPEIWFEALPTYQRTSIVQMRAKGSSYDDIASAWVAAGSSNTAPFSSGSRPEPDPGFLENLRREFRAYLCGDKKYDKDRKQIAVQGKDARMFVVSALSLAIAPHVGSASAVIAPIIVLLLANMGRVSLNAWCSTPANA